MESAALETVGEHFSIEGMLEVRRQTRRAISAIAEQMIPGMTEEDGVAIARRTLKRLGLLRGWHKTYVRFGKNTVREYGNPSDPGVILEKDDIFFIDIGPLLNNFEGDGGATFVVGNDPEMKRAQHDVLELWHRVHVAFQRNGWTGRMLYQFATAEAVSMGWELNLKRMSGHRVGDFPHKNRYEGLLSEVDIIPSPYVWILEMHIRHRERPFGAFYEDLMLPG